jgi:hypothetical protein
MANREAPPARLDWKAVLTSDADGFRALLQTVVQEVLEAEMPEAAAAALEELQLAAEHLVTRHVPPSLGVRGGNEQPVR